MNAYESFLEQVNKQLAEQGTVAVQIPDEQWIMVSCFGYGKTAQEAVENLLLNRKLSRFFPS